MRLANYKVNGYNSRCDWGMRTIQGDTIVVVLFFFSLLGHELTPLDVIRPEGKRDLKCTKR